MVPRNMHTGWDFPCRVSGIIANLVHSIQVCSGGIRRISFLDPAPKKTYDVARFSFGDVHCDVIVSTPITFVMVYLFPFEGGNDRVREVLKFF